MTRTYTIGETERVPVERQAAMVVADGPKWCEPDAQTISDPYFSETRRPDKRGVQLMQIVARLSAEQRASYTDICAQAEKFDVLGNPVPWRAVSAGERIALCLTMLGQPLTRNQNVALTRLTSRQRNAATGGIDPAQRVMKPDQIRSKHY